MIDRWTSRDDEMLESWADAYASLQKKGLVPPVEPEELALLEQIEEEVYRGAAARERLAKVDGFIIGSLVMAAIFVAWRVWA